MDLESFQPLLIDETEKLLTLVQHEYGVPPAYAILFINSYLVANMIAMYKKRDKKPPKELMNYLEKTHKKLLQDAYSIIELQFLQLNTEGNC
jgi:hypothetical protein